MEVNYNRARGDEIKQLIRDVALIKEILFFNKLIKDPEGDLSEWARSELENSRKSSGTDYISIENLKKKILRGK